MYMASNYVVSQQFKAMTGSSVCVGYLRGGVKEVEIAFSPYLTPAISCKVRLNMALKLLSEIEFCYKFLF